MTNGFLGYYSTVKDRLVKILREPIFTGTVYNCPSKVNNCLITKSSSTLKQAVMFHYRQAPTKWNQDPNEECHFELKLVVKW